MPEALVIVDESQSDSVLAQVSEIVNVTQRLPPRLAIVNGQVSALEALRSLPGVVMVSEGTITDSVLQQLNSTERTFVEAWIIGRKPKTARPGEGLPWDAEGFQPPDMPNRSSKP